MKKTISKTEYIKLLRIAKTELRAELKKPTALQDADLISECLESVAYYECEIAELKKERAHRGFLRALGRAGAVFAALIICFAAFATVSEAMGFRVWTAIIKRDAGYLRVDYVPEPSSAPVVVFDGWSDGEYSFFTQDGFAERLVSDGLVPFVAENGDYGFAEGSVRSTEKDYYASCTLRKGTGAVRVRMIAKAGKPTPVTVWGMDESIPYSVTEIAGVSVSYQTQDDGCIFATWQTRGCIFCASMFDVTDPPETILGLIVR